MTLLQIAILACLAVVVGWLGRGRKLALLAISALVLYWLQPYQEPVNLMFWLPTLTLAITAVSWAITSTPDSRGWEKNRAAMLTLLGVVVFVNLNRYFQFDFFFSVALPRFQWIALAVIAVFLAAFGLLYSVRVRPMVCMLAVAGLIGLLALIKTPSALQWLLETLATLRGKDHGGQSVLSWLGFSYIAFRLIHTILDRRAGRLPSVMLAEYVAYVIFFPAIVAGPIDRLERFLSDLNKPIALDSSGWVYAGTRLFSGLFKKFVIADTLAWFALSNVFVGDLQPTSSMWILLYAYSLRIYFDFSGYTDIAIGLGRLLGVQLPENFNSPYLKANLSQFWNSWHVTLTQWFRSYFFNPLTRAMRLAKSPLSPWLMIFVSQVSTMILIGLWHGVAGRFLLWGIWHGLGLFIQNRWSNWSRSRIPVWMHGGFGARVMNISGVFLTFHFVSLGWLFFALPDSQIAWNVLLKFLGVS